MLKFVCLLLSTADYSVLYTSVALCLAASLTLLGLAVAFLFFKIDVALAYRKLLRHFSKQGEISIYRSCAFLWKCVTIAQLQNKN